MSGWGARKRVGEKGTAAMTGIGGRFEGASRPRAAGRQRKGMFNDQRKMDKQMTVATLGEIKMILRQLSGGIGRHVRDM